MVAHRFVGGMLLFRNRLPLRRDAGKNMIHRILICAFVAGSLLQLAAARADDNTTGTTFKNSDGTVQLAMPDGWVEAKSSNSGAAIEVRNEDSDAFVMVRIDDRTDPYATVDDYGKDRRDEILSHLVKSKTTEPKDTQISDHDAVVYEIHGTIPSTKMQLGYVLTLVQFRKHYVQILAWSIEANFNDNAAVLRHAASNVTYTGDEK
jgi:hypothetical protein